MKIEFVANASFLISLSDGRKILTDPWYTDGIYYGAWANFPPLTDEIKQHYITSSPDFIYISHIHPDHFDRRTLANFSKQIPILIGKFPTFELANSIKSLGFKDVRQIEFDRITNVDGIDLSIIKQFEGSGDGFVSDVEYLIDSSLWVRDPNGQTLLNINDNPIKIQDAKKIVLKYGTPDCAILPYGGASGYPHAFRQYDSEEKKRRRDIVSVNRLELFIKIAEIIGSKWTIPAAGASVASGRIAPFTEYFHSATPRQIISRWQKNEFQLKAQQVCIMMPGDCLDLESESFKENYSNSLRNYDSTDRLEYALKLKTRKLAQEGIIIPDDFTIPMMLLMQKSRKTLWEYQCRHQCFPKHDIELIITESENVPIRENGGTHFFFALDLEVPEVQNELSIGRSRTSFYLDSSLMLMILISAANWSNAEMAALIQIERSPDAHNPTIHTLMNYFHL